MLWHSYKVQNPSISLRFWKRKHKVLQQGRNSHRCQHRMGTNQLKSCSAKKGLGTLSEKLSLASNVPSWQRSPVASWVALGRTSPTQGQGMWSLKTSLGRWCPLLNTGETHLEFSVLLWALQYRKGTDLLELVQKKAMKIFKGPVIWGKPERAGTIQLGE